MEIVISTWKNVICCRIVDVAEFSIKNVLIATQTDWSALDHPQMLIAGDLIVPMRLYHIVHNFWIIIHSID